jgi:hypothetical protein
MKSLYSLFVVIPMAASVAFAQSSSSLSLRITGQADRGTSRIYTGTLVIANCRQAVELIGTGVRPANGRVPASKKPAPATAKRDVLRHCQPNPGTTAYALLSEDGKFLRLDEPGNHQVLNEMATGAAGETGVTTNDDKRDLKATVRGSADESTLKVQSLTITLGPRSLSPPSPI